MPALKSELARAAGFVTPPVPSLELKQLEGHWCSEAFGYNGCAETRTLDIKDGALELSTLDAEGHVSASTRGSLKWLDLPEARVLAVSAAADEAEFASPAI